MTNDSIILAGPNYYPCTFKFRALLTDLSSVVQEEKEVITYVASYQANIYVGTSLGQILHYHHFEDVSDYMMISQLRISQDKKPIKKILILPQIERALVLCGDIASAYTIPELSPSHIGKLKKIIDMLYLSHQSSTISEIRPPTINEQVLTVTNDKIRVIQISEELIKRLKDINYSDAIKCIACLSTHSPNYGTLAVVANEKNYDIIDLKQTRKVPLFDYHTDINDNVLPEIVPFFPNDDEKEEEFMLNIKSDEYTTMSMFINSSGDITRGTLLWPNEEHPSNGIVIKWPYAFSICESEGRENRMVVSSLKSLEVEFNLSITGLLDVTKSEQCDKKSVEDDEEELKAERSVPELEDPEVENLSKKLEDDTTVAETTFEHEDNNDIRKKKKYSIMKVHQELEFKDDVLTALLRKTNVKDGSQMNSTSNYIIASSILVYKECDIWLMYEVNEMITLVNEVHDISLKTPLDLEAIKKVTKLLEYLIQQTTNELHTYSIQLLLLFYFLVGDFRKCMHLSFQEIENDSNRISKLVVDPRFLIFVIDDIKSDNSVLSNFYIFTQLYDISNHLVDKKNSQNNFLVEYVEKLYTEILYDSGDLDEELLMYARVKLYQERFTSSTLIIGFINRQDKKMWKIQGLDNSIILRLIKNNHNYFGLLHAYFILLGEAKESGKVEISKEICDLSLRLLGNGLNDPEIKEPLISEIKLDDTSFNLLEIILSQLKDNLNSDKTYSRYLLEVLKINPSLGITFMKSNKANHKETHKRIMEEMSNSFSDEINFSHLRLEYMESNFLETLGETLDLEALDELLIELSKDVISKLDNNNKSNFNILQETYKIENTLKDSKWPKISWSDYLKIRMKQSECRQFIERYLKILELLIVRIQNQDSEYNKTIGEFDELISGESIFDYFKLVYDKKREPLVGLLEFSDYSSAEYFALYSTFQLPVHTHYFDKMRYSTLKNNNISCNSQKKNLITLFQFYVKNDNGDQRHLLAIKHFISTYGVFFTVSEMLEMLPMYFPVTYLQDYLKDVLIDLDTNHRNVVLRKVLNKVDAKFTKDLCKDLCKDLTTESNI